MGNGPAKEPGTLRRAWQYVVDTPHVVAALAFAVFLFFMPTERLEAAQGFAWPAMAVIVALLLRYPIANLLARIIELKWGDKVVKLRSGGVEESPQERGGGEEGRPMESSSIGALEPNAKKILATLWHYQKEHVPNYDSPRRWWLTLRPIDPAFGAFQTGILGLSRLGLIGWRDEFGHLRVFLSERGMHYCKEQDAELSRTDRIRFEDRLD